MIMFKHSIKPVLFLIAACFLSIQSLAIENKSTDLPVTGFSRSAASNTFDAKFLSFLKKWRVPGGASVVVMRNGQVVMNKGYGWADREARNPVQADTLFRIASTSKTFTAVAILKLIQEGRLHLNDRVFNILNDLKPLNGKPINAQIYQITVQNLLQMSSGWFNGGSGHFDPMFGPWPKRMGDVLSPELPASCENTARFMISQPLKYRPGTSYAYSNFDYCLLGLVINKITRSAYGYGGYEQYVQTQLLSALGIRDMHIGSTQTQYRFPNEAKFYQDFANSPQELANSYYLPYSTTEVLKKNFANGGWLATAQDLATFIQALSQYRILNAQMLGVMQQRPAFVAKNRETYYTMGGIIYNLKGRRYWLQTGSFTGTNALIVTKPNGTTIAVVFNYRPETYRFLTKFRPELRRLIINSDL